MGFFDFLSPPKRREEQRRGRSKGLFDWLADRSFEFGPTGTMVKAARTLAPEQTDKAIDFTKSLATGVARAPFRSAASVLVDRGALPSDEEGRKVIKPSEYKGNDAASRVTRFLLGSEEIGTPEEEYRKTAEILPGNTLEKAPGPLAAGLGYVLAGTDFLISPKALLKEGGLKTLASLDNADDVAKVLKNAKYSDEAIADLAPAIAKTKNTDEIKGLLGGDKALSPAAAKKEFGKIDPLSKKQTDLDLNIDKPSAEIPFVNKQRPSAKVIQLGDLEEGRQVATKTTPAGNVVPISKNSGLRVRKDSIGDVEGWKDVGSKFKDLDRLVEAAAPDQATYKSFRDNVIVPREEAVTSMITEEETLLKEVADIAKSLGVKGRKGIVSKRLTGQGKGNKVSAAIQQFGEGRKTQEQLVKEFGEDTAQKIIQANDFFRSKYDELIDRANEVRANFDRDPIPKREDYYTHFNELNTQFGKIFQRRDMSASSDFAKPQAPFNPFAKERTGGEFTDDAFGAFERYLAPTLREIHLTEHVQNLRLHADALTAQAAAKNKDLGGFVNMLNQQADALAGARVGFDKAASDTAGGKKVLDVLDWARGRISKNTILGSVRSTIMQTAAIPQSIEKNGLVNTLAGVKDELAAAISGKASASELSPFLKRRYADVGPAVKTGVQKAEDIAAKPFELFERGATEAIWRSSYRNATQSGFSGKAAIQEADRLTQRIVGGRSAGERAIIFEQTLGNTALPFQLEVNNFMQQVQQDIGLKNILTTKKGAKSAAKLFAATYVFNSMYEGLLGDRPLADPIQAGVETAEKIKEGDVAGAAGRLPAELLSNITGGQVIAGAIPPEQRRRFFGDTEVGRYGGEPAVIRAIQSPEDAATYLATPFAGRQLKRTVEGGQTLAKGYNETDQGRVRFASGEGPGDFISSLLFGPYGTKSGKIYADRDYRPLGEEASNRVKEADDKRAAYIRERKLSRRKAALRKKKEQLKEAK